MANWLREFLMPLTVITIVATVWSLAWANEIQSKAAKAVRESGSQLQITSDGDYPSVRLSAPPCCQHDNVAVVDTGDASNR